MSIPTADASWDPKSGPRLPVRATAPQVFEPPTPAVNEVVITDVDMSIGAMCRFMVKWAIAAIPALLILAVLGFIVSAIFAALFGVGRFL